jgi:hypothetical protein
MRIFMLNLIFSLILAANSYAGLWEVNTGEDASRFYIVIHDRDDVRVYDANWYPSRVRLSKWEGSTLKVDFYPGDKLQMFSVEAELVSDSVKGIFRIPTANFTVEKEASLSRKSTFPYSEPWKILSDRERNEEINLIEFLSQRAPFDSFEDFQKFWNNDFKSRYYYFLYPILKQGSELSPDAESKRVRKFFETLVANRDRISGLAAEIKGKDGFTTVLVPDLGQSSPLKVPVTSYKIPLPPGVKICCGLKTHDIENFQLVKVDLDELSQSSGGEE